MEHCFPADWDGLPLRIDPVTLKMHESQRREDDIRKEYQSQIDRLKREEARLRSIIENNNLSPNLKRTPTTIESSVSHVTAGIRADPDIEKANQVTSLVEVRNGIIIYFAYKCH